GTIEGVKVCYCIEPKAWELLQNNMAAFFASYKPGSSCC
ncbi:MAG: transcriptional regulator, partial [Bacteroidota bacterium]